MNSKQTTLQGETMSDSEVWDPIVQSWFMMLEVMDKEINMKDAWTVSNLWRGILKKYVDQWQPTRAEITKRAVRILRGGANVYFKDSCAIYMVRLDRGLFKQSTGIYMADGEVSGYSGDGAEVTVQIDDNDRYCFLREKDLDTWKKEALKYIRMKLSGRKKYVSDYKDSGDLVDLFQDKRKDLIKKYKKRTMR